jgi:hypothetical protein
MSQRGLGFLPVNGMAHRHGDRPDCDSGQHLEVAPRQADRAPFEPRDETQLLDVDGDGVNDLLARNSPASGGKHDLLHKGTQGFASLQPSGLGSLTILDSQQSHSRGAAVI